MSTIHICNLENKTPPHNKFYTLEITKEGTEYNLYSIHGAIGTNGVRKLIYTNKDYNSAVITSNIYRDKKIKTRGYTLIQETISPTTVEVVQDMSNKILGTAIKTKKQTLKKKKEFSIYNPGRLGALL